VFQDWEITVVVYVNVLLSHRNEFVVDMGNGNSVRLLVVAGYGPHHLSATSSVMVVESCTLIGFRFTSASALHVPATKVFSIDFEH
jgi:hypothetical protein